MTRCFGCMEEYDESFGVCPNCGYVANSGIDEAIHIIPGNMLGNRYVVGKAIGFGGFGVTYIGWDSVLNNKVAIKEYLPSEFSTRVPGQMQITVFEGEKGEQFKSGLDKFVDEAKRLAKFNNTPGIVKVFDSFYENGTAYIIMEYLEGETLSDILSRQKTFPYDTAIGMMMPIMESLKQVHKEGIIHRDIAPDNIMLTKNGEIKLIDFAAARYATTSHSRSLSVIVKQGYSPEEQYRSRGDQGSHTDVYSVASTLYRMITGETPPDALERRAFFEGKKKDILPPMAKYAKDLPVNKETAILNAMNVRIEDRTPDMETFIEELTTDKPVKRIRGKIKKIDILRWPLWLKIAVPTAALAIITLSVLFITGVIGFDANIQSEITLPDGMARVPALVNQTVQNAENIVVQEKLQYYIVGKEYSMEVPQNYVLTQSLNAGYITEQNSVIEVMISGGPEIKQMPACIGKSQDEAVKLLEEVGFIGEFTEEYNMVVPKGYIVSQEHEAGSYLPMGTKMKLVVSMGKDPMYDDDPVQVTVPDFVGKDYTTAVNMAIDSNITITYEWDYSSEFGKNIVMLQDVEPGTVMMNDKSVCLTVSLGVHYVKVPDVIYMTEDQAKKILDDNHLKYEIEYSESETVKKGLVITQSLSDTEMVEANTVIKLTVSKGKGSFEMPDITGMNEKEAKSELSGKGLVVTTSYSKSEDVKEGNVISQSIKAGTQVISGTKVEIVVSSGEPLYEVPDVIGMTANEANSALKDGKFNIQIGEDYDEEMEAGKVFSQTLAPGTQHKKNTDIVIMVSKGKMPLKITLDGNGGKTSKESVTTYLNDTYGDMGDATRTGYTFVGWFTSKNGGTEVTDSTKVTLKADQTLYAHWSANKYIVELDGNGVDSPDDIEVIYDSPYGVLPTLTRTGYGFQGWYTKDGNIEVSPTTIVDIAGDHILVAKWEAGGTTVTFNPNGGTCSTQSISVVYDKTYGELPKPTRTGYTFAGWYTAANGGTEIKSDTVVKVTEEQTLHARWTANTYKVTLDANEGTVSPSSVNVTYAGTYANLPTPTRTGYNFNGWYTAKSGGSKVNKSDTVYINDNIVLYAQWTAATYTITFHGNDGQCSTGAKNVVYKGTYGSLPTATRVGYHFVGWYTTPGVDGTRVYDSTVYTIAGNQTLYAHWDAIKYNIIYYGNGNTGGSTSASQHSYDYSKALTLNGYTKDYYHFVGWSTSPTGSVKYANGASVTNLANTSGQNVALYAIWEVNNSYWAKESNVPTGAKITEYKWKYTLTETKESTSSSLSGWTMYDSYWSQTGSGSANYAAFPSGFDTGHWIYTSMHKSQPYANNETQNTKRTVSTAWAGFIYWHWTHTPDYVNGGTYAWNRVISDSKTSAFTTFYALTSNIDYKYESYVYNLKDLWLELDAWSYWFHRFDYYTCTYVDYQKIYKFKKVTNNLESKTQVTNGGNISNVEKWALYIPKTQ